MASKQTIAGALAFLHELFPTRDITDKTGHAYQLALSDFSDEELQRCVELVAKEPDRKFFPTPGEIIAHRRQPDPIDCDALLGRIEKLGKYLPARGWVYPNIEQVREALGQEIAIAYVDAGAARCFAPEDANGQSISRDIARRKFAELIEQAHRRTPGGLQLPAPKAQQQELLTAGDPAHQPVSSTPTGEQKPSREQSWRGAVPAPSFPTTTRGRVAVGIAYRRALEDMAVRWASDHPEEDDALIAAVDERLAGKFATRVGRMAAINDARAAASAFPDFDAWCKQQGYVVVEPPSTASTTP